MEAVDVRGRFVWHQLMTRDVPGAKKFYSTLVGWKTLPWPLDPAYTVCHAEAGPIAGIMEIPAELPADVCAHWLLYVGTRDVDGTAEAAVRAGGSIVKEPGDMPGAGRYAVLKDPQGAVFAVIDPENARPEPEGMPPLGAFSWHELATSDNEAAFSFYSGLFGWDAVMRMDMGPMGTYLIFGWNGAQRGGMYIKPQDYPGPASWLPYAHVPNVDAGFALARTIGGKEMVAPMDVPGGSRVATIVDAGGAAFAIHAMPGSGPMASTASAAPSATRPKSKAPTRTKPKRKPIKRTAPAKRSTPVKKKAPAKKKSAARKPASPKKVVKKVVRKKASKSAPRRKPVARKKSKAVRRKK